MKRKDDIFQSKYYPLDGGAPFHLTTKNSHWTPTFTELPNGQRQYFAKIDLREVAVNINTVELMLTITGLEAANGGQQEGRAGS